MGIALGDGQPNRTEEVLKDAELAMYHAKRIGGDRIEVFKPSMRARKSDRLTLESELRRALERDEISILYQPIIRWRTVRLRASRRWHAGTTPRWAGCRRPTSSPLPRRSG